jgi:hypothetical protein
MVYCAATGDRSPVRLQCQYYQEHMKYIYMQLVPVDIPERPEALRSRKNAHFRCGVVSGRRGGHVTGHQGAFKPIGDRGFGIVRPPPSHNKALNLKHLPAAKKVRTTYVWRLPPPPFIVVPRVNEKLGGNFGSK